MYNTARNKSTLLANGQLRLPNYGFYKKAYCARCDNYTKPVNSRELFTKEETDGQRQRDRQTDRDKETGRDRENEQRERERERERECTYTYTRKTNYVCKKMGLLQII